MGVIREIFRSFGHKLLSMQLAKIALMLEAFETYLSGKEAHEQIFIWETQQRFQEYWDLEAPDLAQMYQQALENTVTRRLWSAEHYAPKLMMTEFIKSDGAFVRQLFLDLFNESKAVEGRMGRFIYHCDQLMERYREQYKKAVHTSHYHDDNYFMVSLYLSMRYPSLYAPYHHEGFIQLLKTLGAKDIPVVCDPDRYFKVARTLYNMMKKEETLLARHQARLDPALHYSGESLLLIYDCCLWNLRQASPGVNRQ
jgi:hypothetical protein